MEKEEIIILDEGLGDSPIGPDMFCCAVFYVPYRSI